MDYRTEDFIAGGAMISVGLVGIFCNALILFSLHKSFLSSSFSAFSVLCCSRALSNCGTLLCFVLYSGPVALLGRPYGPDLVGLKFGHFTTLTYKTVVYVQLAIAFNRFIAIFFTFKYHRICNRTGTFILLGCVWFVAGLHCIAEFVDGCGYTFFYVSLAWDYIDTPCSNILIPLFFYPSHVIFISSITLNAVIFVKLSYHTIRNSKQMGSQAKERHRKNARSFIQSFLQELMYIFESLLLEWTRPDRRIFAFITYSLVWELTHVWDGLIVVLYCPEVRSRLPFFLFFKSWNNRVRKVSIVQSPANSSGLYNKSNKPTVD